MSNIKELQFLEHQYQKILSSIISIYEEKLCKSDQIKIKKWIKKLSSVIDNIFWRRNRNLYCKVLYIMIKNSSLHEPFNKNPPEKSLPNLSLYELPYNIKKQLTCNQNLSQQKLQSCFEKQSIIEQGKKFYQKNLKLYQNKQNNQNTSNNQFKQQKINRLSFCQIRNKKKNNFNQKLNCLKEKFVKQQSQEDNKNQLAQEISILLQQSLIFMSKHYQKICQSKKDQDELKKIVRNILNYKPCIK